MIYQNFVPGLDCKKKNRGLMSYVVKFVNSTKSGDAKYGHLKPTMKATEALQVYQKVFGQTPNDLSCNGMPINKMTTELLEDLWPFWHATKPENDPAWDGMEIFVTAHARDGGAIPLN